MQSGVSLNKYIAQTGFCSRRAADEYIDQLRVTINNKDVVKGARVMEGDIVKIDGELIKKAATDYHYLILNKPKGVTCTTDTKDKTNIIDYVNYKTRLFPIGRLDKRSEGLIFLTNDGDIVNKILRAGNNHEKEYIVTVEQPLSIAHIQTMRSGMRILGVRTQKCFVQQEGEKRFRIILTQGLNRQIRRMCEELDYTVTSLRRIRIMHINIKGLALGSWRYFTKDEMQMLNDLLKNSSNSSTISLNDMEE